MGEANQTRLALVQRTSFATPAALNLLALPIRSQNLKNNLRKTTSQMLRTDANIQDVIRLQHDSGGGVELELTFPVVSEALWYLLRALLRATEDAERSEASCTTTAGAKTITKAAIDFTAGNTVQVDDIVKVSGSTAGADDGFYRVTAVAATTVTVARDSNFTGSVGNVTLRRGARMINGTQKYYFDAEVARLDIPLYQLFEKVVANAFDLTVSEDILTLRLQLLGAPAQQQITPFALGITNPTVSAVMDHLGVPDIRFNDLQSSSKSLGLSVNNNIAVNTRVGLAGVDSFSWGSMEVQTRWSGYLATWNEMNDYVANTARKVWWVMQDSGSRALSFLLPDHKWLDLTTDTRGLNQTDYVDGRGQSVALNQAHAIRMQRWN